MKTKINMTPVLLDPKIWKKLEIDRIKKGQDKQTYYGNVLGKAGRDLK